MLAVGHVAHAQTHEDDAATRRRALIESARRASSAGDHQHAVERALEADAIRSSPSLRQFIAAEQVALGDNVGAFHSASRCVDDATADPATPQRERQIAACDAIRDDLRARVGRLVLRVDPRDIAGLAVRIGGRTLEPNESLASQIVAPGTVHIEAAAPGFVTVARDVTVEHGTSVNVELQLVRDHVVRATNTSAATLASAAPTRTDNLAIGRRALSPAPFVVMGVGAATLVASLAVGLARNGAIADFEQRYGCNGDACTDPRGAAAVGSLDTWNTATNVTLVAGSVILGAGLVWLVVDAATRGPAVRPYAAVDGRGAFAGFGGSF